MSSKDKPGEEPSAAAALAGNPPAPDPADAAAREQLIGDAARYGLPVLAICGALIAGWVQGPPMAILVLAAGALVAVIATFWASVRTLVGETALTGADAYALGAPRAEEEQKRSVLRALKDLEFERSVGKISDEDYKVLVAKYRAEAKRLLRLLDTENDPGRQKVEALVAKRLRREGLVDEGLLAAEAGLPPLRKGKKRKKDPADGTPAVERSAGPEEASRAEARACESCGTANDADAVFCKKCGARQASTSEAGAIGEVAAEADGESDAAAPSKDEV
jgi:hypothetical protein